MTGTKQKELLYLRQVKVQRKNRLNGRSYDVRETRKEPFVVRSALLISLYIKIF